MEKLNRTSAFLIIIFFTANAWAFQWSQSSYSNYNGSTYYNYAIDGGNGSNSSFVSTETGNGDSGLAQGIVTNFTNARGYNSSTDIVNDSYYTQTSQTTGMAFDFIALGSGRVEFDVNFDTELYFNRTGNYWGEATIDLRSYVKQWMGLGGSPTTIDSWVGGASIGYYTNSFEDFSFDLEGLATVGDHALINEIFTYSFDVIEGTRYTVDFSLNSIITNRMIGLENAFPTAYADAWNTIGFGDDGNTSFWENVRATVGLESVEYPDVYFYTPINDVPVPIPSTIILLGTGLVGLFGASRKKFKNR